MQPDPRLGEALNASRARRRKRLYDTYFTRTLDQAAAERFVGKVWLRFNLPEVEE
jgi:hypothetical protein